MNKKVLMVAIFLIAAIVLPAFATVQAAPKETVTFNLYIQGGIPGGLHATGQVVMSPDKRYDPPPPDYPPPEGYAVMHFFDAPFKPTDVWLEVDGQTIPYSLLVYTATVSGSVNWLTETSDFKYDETVTIFSDSSKTTVWGTLEIRTVTHSPYPPPVGVVIGTFEGHGTGAIEGVKVQGTTSTEMIGSPSKPAKVRDGIAMNWP